jgi:hypothetical protein
MTIMDRLLAYVSNPMQAIYDYQAWKFGRQLMQAVLDGGE